MVASLTRAAGFTAEFVANACQGELRGTGLAKAVSTDSRGAVVDTLFIALRGPNHDGHDHVVTALANGAAGVVVEELDPQIDLGTSFAVVVRDTRAALQDLARAHRARLPGKVIGITGSCGKTTTKEIAATLFQDREIVVSEKSFNNDIGVPMTLLRARDETEFVVCEIGTNAPGEIASLTRIADPDIVVITLVGRGHLEGLGTVDGVLQEKTAIIAGSRPESIVVLNADDANIARLREAAGGRRTVTFGVTHRASVHSTSLRTLVIDGQLAISFDVEVLGHHLGSAVLRRPGLHDVRNFLAVLAIGVAIEGDAPGAIAALVERAAHVRPTPRRLESKVGAGGVQILDDSYNANPESLLAALSVLDRIRHVKRRVLVLGDMRELGEQARAIHEESGVAAAGRVDLLVAVGSLAACAARAFHEETGKPIVLFEDVDALIPELPALFGAGDFVLFKGSRAVALDRAVDAMTGAAG
ncbi:MAG: UDP-N-acetylmuramoyl-tripeptide--D-alanyl-D-alanine ligase [Planctomycetes bacterium]|nr:UDP-N-acetylmuramoyl-tripeptide--D-alanyl-D-alanine ligase [Planctomycetota bacterium]